MKWRGSTVAVVIFLSLLLGAGGMYVGMTALTDDSQDMLNGEKVKAEQTIPRDDLEKIQKTYELIVDRYVQDVEEDELLEGAIQGMIETLDDPYSVYMNVETAEQFTESLESSFEGIGAEVSMQNGKVTIVAPFKDSPAEQAGLKPNDKILKIDGESIEGLDLYEAVLKIRGEKGTTVTLSVERPGVAEALQVDVTRDEIPIETVYSNTIERDGQTIGVLEITSFSDKTAEDFEDALQEHERNGIDGLVIDVRGNPGGYLNSVDAILRDFIPNSMPFVQIEDRSGQVQRYVSSLKGKKPYPIVTLIDRGSASASEILAAAMKEAGGYDVVGETSFGKGTVQQTMDMGDGSNIKLTMFKWLTPNGNWIHEKGVEPTVDVKQPDYFYAHPFSVEENELTFDDNDPKIESAQHMLKGLGYSPGRTDGYFSQETVSAVKAFQQTNDLPVTGKLDQETAGKLQSRVADSVREQENDLQLQTAIELLVQQED